MAPAGSGCASGSRTAERLVTLIPETAPSLAVGSQGAGCLEPVTEGGEEGFSQSPPPSPSRPKVRSQRTAAWCPLVGLDDALSEALEWGDGEKGAQNPGQKNREGPSARPVGPPPWPSRCPGAGLGSSEQPGRELKAMVCPGPMGIHELGARPAEPSPTSTPQGCALRLSSPSPNCSPRTGPHSVSPCPGTLSIPSARLSGDGGGGKGTAQAADSFPSPQPSPGPRA